ncbi:MAG: hypothetical protein EOM46_29275 [Gammaproteobacteria bacterium]|nr:hypothetical protein [Gammaproteobacteria bacterium]
MKHYYEKLFHGVKSGLVQQGGINVIAFTKLCGTVNCYVKEMNAVVRGTIPKATGIKKASTRLAFNKTAKPYFRPAASRS